MTWNRDIDENDNILDARDIGRKAEEMEAEREALEEVITEAEDEVLEAQTALDDFDPEDYEDQPEIDDMSAADYQKARLQDALEDAEETLLKAKEELEDWDDCYGDDLSMWKGAAEELGSLTIHGETLINEDYWEEYCQQLVRDIGDIPDDLPSYIENNIDWSGVADDLKVDYTEIEIGGNTFYHRYY